MNSRVPLIGWMADLKPRSPADLYLIFVAAVLPWQDHQIFRKGITLFHVINAVFVCGILIYLLVRGPRPRWHLLTPVYVYWIGSVLGMFNTEVYSINVYTLAQDLYLYFWFVTMCVLLDSDRRVDVLIIAWTIVLVLVLSQEGFIAHGDASQRGEFSFRNPNRAAAYLTMTFFLLLRPVVPWAFKIVLGAMVVIGVGATGSAAGSIGLGMAAFTFVWCVLYSKGGRSIRPILFLTVFALALLVAVMNPLADRDLPAVLGGLAPTAAPRIERSADTREEIWSKGMESFREHPLGIGPASFHRQIDSGVSDDGSIELHSDFVASLVERGIVGFLGYLLIIVWTARELFRILNRSHKWNDVIWAAALAGGCVTYFFYSVTHEALHHETFWLLLSFVFCQVRILESNRARESVVEIEEQTSAIAWAR